MLTSYDILPYSYSSESGDQYPLHRSVKTILSLLPQETSENVRKVSENAFKYLWTALCFETAVEQTNSLDSHKFREHVVDVIT